MILIGNYTCPQSINGKSHLCLAKCLYGINISPNTRVIFQYFSDRVISYTNKKIRKSVCNRLTCPIRPVFSRHSRHRPSVHRSSPMIAKVPQRLHCHSLSTIVFPLVISLVQLVLIKPNIECRFSYFEN